MVEWNPTAPFIQCRFLFLSLIIPIPYPTDYVYKRTQMTAEKKSTTIELVCQEKGTPCLESMVIERTRKKKKKTFAHYNDSFNSSCLLYINEEVVFLPYIIYNIVS
jgi:hypothetical protein